MYKHYCFLRLDIPILPHEIFLFPEIADPHIRLQMEKKKKGKFVRCKPPGVFTITLIRRRTASKFKV